MPTHIGDASPVTMDLRIMNARLVTPSSVQRGTLAVRDGVIVAIDIESRYGDVVTLEELRAMLDAPGGSR